MTNQEINEAVAWKLGWKVNKPPYVTTGYKKGERWIVDHSVPAYSTSIEAAWEIVEKIEWFCLEKEHDGSGWTVFDMAGTEEAELICTADTAPRAICEAFLKLLDSQLHGESETHV